MRFRNRSLVMTAIFAAGVTAVTATTIYCGATLSFGAACGTEMNTGPDDSPVCTKITCHHDLSCAVDLTQSYRCEDETYYPGCDLSLGQVVTDKDWNRYCGYYADLGDVGAYPCIRITDFSRCFGG